MINIKKKQGQKIFFLNGYCFKGKFWDLDYDEFKKDMFEDCIDIPGKYGMSAKTALRFRRVLGVGYMDRSTEPKHMHNRNIRIHYERVCEDMKKVIFKLMTIKEVSMKYTVPLVFLQDILDTVYDKTKMLEYYNKIME